MLMERLMLEKEEYGTRQEEEMCRLLKKQDEESQFLARYIKPKSTICTLHAPPPHPLKFKKGYLSQCKFTKVFLKLVSYSDNGCGGSTAFVFIAPREYITQFAYI